jgi:hypothetical protein
MKNMLILFILIIFAIGIGYDLKYGTLEATAYNTPNQISPNTKETNKNSNAEKTDVEYVEVKVQAGQTVLSIVEELHEGNTSVSISKIVEDFEVLNKETDAQTIKTGKTYRFPIY